MVAAASAETLRALWLLPALVLLHVAQLALSAKAWRVLLPAPPAGWGVFQRLRLIREGIDSLLPVAQVGGEVVGVQLLTQCGVPGALATASVVVDVALEVLSQLVFLLLGVAVWAALTPLGEVGPLADHERWLGLGVLAAAAGGLVAAQRFGLLRLADGLVRQIAARLPTLGGLSLDGLHTACIALYQRRRAVVSSGALHLLAWLLGTAEAWAVLRAIGFDISLPVALVIESLGMAGRSAGFAVPGALVIQETGFALAAAAMGLPDSAGLALSLIKRVREIATGLIGLALWRGAARAV